MNLAVFVSGGGTNLQAIIDAIDTGDLVNCNIGLVVADRPCYATERAKAKNINCVVFNRKEINHKEMVATLQENNISHIVLTGYLSIVDESVCRAWKNKIINIHPSLLPKHGGKGMYGSKVHQSVLTSKDSVSGATVHYVTEGIDEGEIIIQKQVAVAYDETVESLQQKVLNIEHEILIESLKIVYDKEKGADQRL